MPSLAVWLLLLAGPTALATPVIRHSGSVFIYGAAKVSVESSFPKSSSPALLVSTITPFIPDKVYVIRDVAQAIDGQTCNATVLLDGERWPNQVSLVPHEVFNHDALAVASGFLVPGKNPGAVEIGFLDSCLKFKLSRDKPGYFYSKIIWTDIDGDGRLDVLTARAAGPMAPWAQGQMLWLRQPEDPLKCPWEEHVLFEGVDHDFLYTDFGARGGVGNKPQILAANLFGTRDLALYVCDTEWPKCTHPAKVTIDGELGPFYDVHKVDLNGDGRDDILVSNFRIDGRGAVLAYECPAEGVMGNWTRHVLAFGYKPLKKTQFRRPGQGAPGILAPFYLPSKNASKPWILVGGESSGLVQLLKPRSQNASDWHYDAQTILQRNGPIGGVAAYDVNDDGFMDFFVADYSGNKVEIFTLLDDELEEA